MLYVLCAADETGKLESSLFFGVAASSEKKFHGKNKN